MYAIIQTGGKQLRVEPGEKIRVEQLDANIGEDIEFEDVLLVVKDNETLIGTPHVENSPVFAKVLDHGRGKKIKVVKMKRRKNYRRTQGHRQNYTELEILSIGKMPKAKKQKAAKPKAAKPKEKQTEFEEIESESS